MIPYLFIIATLLFWSRGLHCHTTGCVTRISSVPFLVQMGCDTCDAYFVKIVIKLVLFFGLGVHRFHGNLDTL
jgi:hypothetical protein